ncbi:MAG: dienelactone hydrolase family protein [Deltaproteobacteria bacterium]|nr:dienelactone hydrolase family protein [Deltaproteobacteria bacterium]MBI3079243.1 dienelactone hydrolase family protein [Deltaproteobacteria bacterium]
MATEIVTADVQYPGEGVTLRAHLARPKAEGRHPAVIVIQEWWGLNDHIKEVAGRFAREGYVGVAPDLYSRAGHKVTKDPNEAGQLMMGLDDTLALKDFDATVAYLQQQVFVNGQRIGVVGFCMGGTYTTLLAAHNKAITAASAFYGQIVYDQTSKAKPVSPLDAAKRITCPYLYIYGEADGWITMDHVGQLKKVLASHPKAEVKTYPNAPHAFFNDTRADVYRPEAAKDAWDRTLKLFAQHLRG